MSYHITVDHRSAPQIPTLLKQKLKSTLAIWSGINVGSLLPQGRKLGTESVATAFCWSRVGEWQSHVLRHARSPRQLLGVRQLLSLLLWCQLALSTEPEKSEQGWGCSTPGNGAGGGGCLQCYKLYSTWYHQSHCSSEQSGVQWSPSQLMFYRWPLAFMNIFPPNLRKKNHP